MMPSLLLKRLLCLTGLFFLATASCWAGKIYKWVDEHGVTQFSTFPPLNQKKDQSVTTVRGLSTPVGTTSISAEDLHYVWFTIDNRTKYTLSFINDGFTYRPQESSTSSGLTSSGKWKLDGGVLELTYTYHKDKRKQGTKETFFVKKPDKYSLILIAKKGNKRLHFRKDTNLLKSDKAISRLAQHLIGFWKGVGGGDSILFSNETFELAGMRKTRVSTHNYEAVGTKYKGRWSVDDPYITLEITLDEVYKLENIQSQVGQQRRWLIVNKNANTLTVRDATTRRLMKFVKTGI